MKSKVQAIYKETVQQLAEIYGEAEADSIANVLFEDFLHIPKIQRLTRSDLPWPPELKARHAQALELLLDHQPIQYVVGHCFFYGGKFEVNKNTLIPRPETEELVDLIVNENKHTRRRVLDIGTGTGCIAISLAAALPESEVFGWDISDEALAVAKRNAQAHQTKVHFKQVDVLTYEAEEKFDLMVSNPPYIPYREKSSMAENVLRYEPGTALFVPDEDPLLFYRRIGELGKTSLTDGGRLYFEVHESYGKPVQALLMKLGYHGVSVKKDLQGKDRMIRASVSPVTNRD